jgi:hypothetical protein
MMQIMNPRSPEEAESAGEERAKPREKGQKKMAWLFLSPLEGKKQPDRRLNEIVDAVRLQIGSYYYWIRVIQSIPELCRLEVRKDSLILYEVLQHDNLGISDDDLEDAVRQANGELIVAREYRISNHIKRKLQVLYAP